jgi:ParB/RepB/Spo0J family partition protein
MSCHFKKDLRRMSSSPLVPSKRNNEWEASPMPATKIETGVHIELKRLRLTAIARKHRPEKTVSLAKSLKEGRAQIQDIVVCPHDEAAGAASELFDVLAGVGRKEAEESLGWEKGRCTIMYGLSPYEKLKVTLDENEERQPTGPLDDARIYQGMLDTDKGLTQGELAKRQGMSQPRLNDYLSLAKLPQGVREIIRNLINLKLDHLVQICRLKTPEDQIALAKKSDEEEWTVKKLKAAVDGKLRKDPSSSPAVTAAPAVPAESAVAAASAATAVPIPDPFSKIWAPLGLESSIAIFTWDVSFNHRPGYGAGSPSGWNFWVSSQTNTPKTAIKQVLKAIISAIGDTTEEEAKARMNVESITSTEGQKPLRLPNTDEEANEAMAQAFRGPGALYAWIFGTNSPIAQKTKTLTWQALGVIDVDAAYAKIIDDLRKTRDMVKPASPPPSVPSGSTLSPRERARPTSGSAAGEAAAPPIQPTKKTSFLDELDPETRAMVEEDMKLGKIL